MLSKSPNGVADLLRDLAANASGDRSQRRSRMTVSALAGTVRSKLAAALVPLLAGFTALVLPLTIYSLIPSFTYGVLLSAPKSLALFVSFSVNRNSGLPSAKSHLRP